MFRIECSLFALRNWVITPRRDDHDVLVPAPLMAEPGPVDLRSVILKLDAFSALCFDGGIFLGIMQTHPAGLAAFAAVKGRQATYVRRRLIEPGEGGDI